MILLLGGTSESLQIADELTRRGLPFVLSVTTDYGEELSEHHARMVSRRVLTPKLFTPFLIEHHIHLIIDATHPFARVVSQIAIEASIKNHVGYIRFERPQLVEEGPYLKLVDNLKEACNRVKSQKGIVYLSTGSKTADKYAEIIGIQRLHVRVLPTEYALKKLANIGFSTNQIDAIQGPFSTKLNVELFSRANSSFVITKESGRRGGVQEKIKACESLKIQCVVIKRPVINYPEKVSTFDSLWEKMKVIR